MKIGCCASIEQAQKLYEAGYDFIECTVVSLIPEKSDEEFAEVFKQYENSPLPVEAFNVLLPGDLKIVGPEVDQERIKKYMEVALARVKQIGGDTVVFGSGDARTYVNDDFPRGKAEEQIIDFLNISAPIAEALGIMIVIEPLNQGESNIINSVPEAVQFAKKVNHPSVQVLADFYHMDEENEPLENIVTSRTYVKHIHVADTGRLAPGTGKYPYGEFVDCVNRANYKGRISIECDWENFDQEIKQAREYLVSLF